MELGRERESVRIVNSKNKTTIHVGAECFYQTLEVHPREIHLKQIFCSQAQNMNTLDHETGLHLREIEHKLDNV